MLSGSTPKQSLSWLFSSWIWLCHFPLAEMKSQIAIWEPCVKVLKHPFYFCCRGCHGWSQRTSWVTQMSLQGDWWLSLSSWPGIGRQGSFRFGERAAFPKGHKLLWCYGPAISPRPGSAGTESCIWQLSAADGSDLFFPPRKDSVGQGYKPQDSMRVDMPEWQQRHSYPPGWTCH